MSQSESEMYPLGCLNMGLAHGLAGVGCILAYAHIKGYSNEASLSALQKIIFACFCPLSKLYNNDSRILG